MIVAIDSGNSLTKIGLFEEGKLIKIFEKKSFSDIVPLVEENNPKSIIISSVHYPLDRFKESFKSKKLFFIANTIRYPFKINYKTKTTLGADRLSAAAGALSLYKNQNILIIQTGTCFTYDFLNQNGEYLGGGISPGIEMRFKALHHYTENLPIVNFIDQIPLIGQSTESSIQSGVINGSIAEIQGIIHRYEKDYDNIRIVLSGGFTNFFEYKLKGSIFAIPNLVLLGLFSIYQFNEETENG